MADPKENWRSVTTTIGERDYELEPDNCEIWRFRHDGEHDYFHVFIPKEPETELYEHTVVFRKKHLLVWMGGVAMRGDAKIMREVREELGHDFTELSGGWRPVLHIADYPTEPEKEWYTQLLLQDLNNTEGVPDEFAGEL